ncbi:centromere protein R [Spea bombifrons]|uniref:centromere protein R n=1 Tax=Spea bombifrons TaxID=233779 RepID=UPI0023491BE8|nr:centromere protein R [Spea bombifrons]
MSLPVRRSLKLDTIEKNKNERSRPKTPVPLHSYSPTTGTRQMSPFTAVKKRSAKSLGQERTQGRADADGYSEAAEPEVASRGQRPTDENDELLELLSEVEKSVTSFLKMRQSLKNLQALEGSKEPELLLGPGDPSTDLKAELRKTKVLITEARKKKKQKTR